MPNDALHGLLDEIDSQPVAPRKSTLTSVLDEVDSESEPGSYRQSGMTKDRLADLSSLSAMEDARMAEASAKRLSELPGGSNAFVRNVGVGLAQTGQDAASLAMRVTGQGDKADEFNRQGNQLGQAAAIADENSVAPEWLNRALRGTSRSLSSAVLAPGGSAPAMIGQAAAIRGNQAITEGGDAGLTPWNTAKYAARAAAVEGGVAALFQKVGMGGLESMMASKAVVNGGIKEALKRTGLSTLEELPEEISTEVLDNVNQALSNVAPNAISSESLKQTVLDTAAQTIMSVGFAGGGRYVANRLAPAQDPVVPPISEQSVTPVSQRPVNLTPQERADFERVLSGVTAQPDEVITPISGGDALTPRTGYNPPVSLSPEEIKTLQYRDTMPPDLATLDNSDMSMPSIDPLWNYSPEELRDWGRSHVDEGETQESPIVNDVIPEAITGENTEANARIRQPNIRPEPITASGADTQIRAPITIKPKFDESATTQNDIRLPKQDISPQMEQTSTRLDIPIFNPGEVVTTPADGHGEVIKSLRSGKVLVDVGDKIVSMNANEVSRANEQGNHTGTKSGRGGPVRDTGVTPALSQAPVQQRAQAVPAAPAQVAASPVVGSDTVAPKVAEPKDQGHAKANAHIDSLKLSPTEDAAARSALIGWNPALDPEGYKGNIDSVLKFNREKAASAAKKSAAVPPIAERKVPPAPVAESKPAQESPQAAPAESSKTYTEPAPEPKGRPDLANPAKNEKAREFVDAIDEQNKDQPTAGLSRSELRENARKRISTDRAKVRQEIDDLVMTGESPTREQAETWRQLIDEETAAATKPDATLEQKSRAALLVTAYRQSGSEAARILGDRADTELTPEERLANVRESLLELPQNLRAEVDRLTKQMRKRREQEQARTESKVSDTSNAKQKVKGARKAVDDAFKKLAADLKKSLQGGSLGAMGGQQLDILTKMLANRVAAGVLKFSDVVLDVVEQVREFRKNPEMHEALEKAWNTLADKNSQLERAKVGDAEKAVSDRLAQQRLERDAERLASGKEEPERHRIREIHEGWAKRQEKLKGALKQLGYDVEASDPDWAKDPAKAARVLRYVAGAKSDVWDKAYEYRLASMLSGITTHAVNITSNAAHALWDMTVQRGAEIGVNTLTRQSEGAQLGEIKHLVSGMLPGLSLGMRNAVQAFRDEAPVLERQVRGPEYTGRTSFDERPGAIGGTKGRVIRTPLTMLLVADDFFKSIIASMESGARAYRIAKGEGRKGQALEDRIRELHGNMRSQAWQEAIGKGEEVLFQDSNGVTKAIEGVINAGRNLDPYSYESGPARAGARVAKEVARHSIPFLRTVLSLFSKGIRKSPLGSASLAARLLSNGIGAMRHGKAGWTYQGDPLVRDIAEQVLAWGAIAAIYGMIDPDDEDPVITGSMGGHQPAKNSTLQRTNLEPYSIRIGDKRYNYSKIEPFATALGLTVDGVLMAKRNQSDRVKGDMLGDATEAIMGQVKQKTFLSGLGDLIRTLQGDDSKGSFAQNFATSWVPNIIRGTNKALDPLERDPRAMPEATWSERTIRSMGVPFVPPAPPRVDVWGNTVEKIKSPVSPGPASDFLFRLISPMRVETAKMRAVDHAILSWNNQHPDDPFWPSVPQPTITINGKSQKLSDDDYQALLKTGAVALKKIESRRFDPENPDEDDIKAFKKALDEARNTVRTAIKSRLERAQVKR